MPTDKNGNYTRINPADYTNHGGYSKEGSMPKASDTKSKTITDPMGDNKVTMGSGYGANSPTNVPRSSNLQNHPVVTPGQPALPGKETDGSGSKTLAGDPSFSAMSTANSKPTYPHNSDGKGTDAEK